MKIIEIIAEIKINSRAEGRPYVRFTLTREDGHQLQFDLPGSAARSARRWNTAIQKAEKIAENEGFDLDLIEIHKLFQQVAEQEVV